MSEITQTQGTSEDSKTIITVILLVFFFPIGLILMWVWTKWPLWLKVTITGISVMMAIFTIFIVGAVFIGFMSAFNPKGSIEKARQMSEQRNSTPSTVEGVEGDNYTFYYPSGYVETEPGNNNSTLFFSKANSIHGEGVSLILNESTSRRPVPTDKTCETAADESAKKEDGTILKVTAVADSISHGCEVLATSQLSGAKDLVVIHYKELWYKAGNDYDTYASMATYFSNSQDKDILTEAVNKFELK